MSLNNPWRKIPWWKIPWQSLLSLTASALILVVGWQMINGKVREKPSIQEDSILTPDEIANLPTGTLVAVLPQGESSEPRSFVYRLLQLALSKSGEPHAIGYGNSITDQQASIQRIAASMQPSRQNPTGLNVGLFGVGKEIDRRLKPVPIPALGGLLGLRALWVNSNRVDRFRFVRQRADLGRAIAVQGIGWSDVEVLRAAGIRTYTTETVKILELINQDRVDFYPKGITELEEEAQLIEARYGSVALEKNLLLAYPFAMLFYLHPDNTRLHAAIQRGLERAVRDGSYLKLLNSDVVTPRLRNALRLRGRRVLSLPNPDAAALLKEVDPKYWLVPWKDISQGRLERGEDLCGFPVLQELCGPP